MDDLLSEKEQIEKMRTWWSDYGSYVIGGVVLGAAILYGINHYQSSQLQQQYAASALYDSLADHVAEGRLDAAETVASELTADFGDSIYFAQSKLAMARLYLEQNRDQDAKDTLNSLISSTASEEFKNVARVRLSKIMLYQGEAEAVIDLLEGRTSRAFSARYAEIRGDAYTALDRFAEARVAYQVALAESGGAATVDQSFVQLKLLDLPIETFADTDGVTEENSAEGIDDVSDETAVETSDVGGDSVANENPENGSDEGAQ